MNYVRRMITTFRQLLTAIHENNGFNNWADEGGFDEGVAELAEGAERAGLITIRRGWGGGRSYALTNSGRHYLGLPEQFSFIDRLLSWLTPKRSAGPSHH
ncbi:hypothetical protein [Rhizobium grahamii]|uniref:Transcriptional regulator n=1 Tax=Rhizobium grahamii CCGE 502 TaxID=990285 RepID=S3HIP6_9HYPH|nr:hypothetical protein [Rhizobium grahamii]EPE98624.1 hypothetical protein RGCCGE502_09365 [Rhizobium grahamii CCGE 502]